jgi:hypothetical protein
MSKAVPDPKKRMKVLDSAAFRGTGALMYSETIFLRRRQARKADELHYSPTKFIGSRLMEFRFALWESDKVLCDLSLVP